MTTADCFVYSATSTAILTSSVLAFRKIHGRTYHNFREDVEYWYAPPHLGLDRATQNLTGLQGA